MAADTEGVEHRGCARLRTGGEVLIGMGPSETNFGVDSRDGGKPRKAVAAGVPARIEWMTAWFS